MKNDLPLIYQTVRATGAHVQWFGKLLGVAAGQMTQPSIRIRLGVPLRSHALRLWRRAYAPAILVTIADADIRTPNIRGSLVARHPHAFRVPPHAQRQPVADAG